MHYTNTTLSTRLLLDFRRGELKMIKYNPQDEWHLDPNSSEGLSFVKESLGIYKEFASKYSHTLDLKHPLSIETAYEAAQAAGIFTWAKTIRQTFFGNDIHFYGVTYLWDMCLESCVYCPASIENRKRTKYKPLSLSIEEAVRDVQYVMQDGHRHICILTGEDPIRFPPSVLAEYIRALDELGLNEIILNIEPPTNPEDFKLWRTAARHTALQFRIFQETYNRTKYAQIHPITKYGKKHLYDYRYRSQEIALSYGFDNVGLGVLFGNHNLPIEELDNLQRHAQQIKLLTGKSPARVCLPSAKYLEDIQVDISHSLDSHHQNLYVKFSELIYALAKLAMPTINIVSSERDDPALLAKLEHYAACTTLNVHPGVGDNIRHHEQSTYDGIHFEQAPSFSRHPSNTLTEMKIRGFNPIIGKTT